MIMLKLESSLLVIHNRNQDMTIHQKYEHLYESLDLFHFQTHIICHNDSISLLLVVWLWVRLNYQKKISRPYRLQYSNHNFPPILSNFKKCSHQIFFHCQPELLWVWVPYWDNYHPMISSWICAHSPCKFCSNLQVFHQTISQGKLNAWSSLSNNSRESVKILLFKLVFVQKVTLKVV